MEKVDKQPPGRNYLPKFLTLVYVFICDTTAAQNFLQPTLFQFHKKSFFICHLHASNIVTPMQKKVARPNIFISCSGISFCLESMCYTAMHKASKRIKARKNVVLANDKVTLCT